MARPPLDELVGWRTGARGKVTALDGAVRSHRIGPLGRFLLPDLDQGFADPGDLLCLIKPPGLAWPIVAAANLTRRTATRVPRMRGVTVMLALFALGVGADLLLESGWPMLAGAVAGGLVTFLLRDGEARALAFAEDEAASRAELYWALARHMLGAAPRPKPEPEPEPDWVERLACSFAGTLADHEWVEAGRLPVPDGRLVACDPFDIARARRLAIPIPPGTHPVALAVGRFGPPRSALAESRVAHAWIRIASGPAVRWERVVGEAGEEIEVSVDSAAAAFTSAAAVPALLAAYGEGEEQWLDPRLTAEMQRQMDPSPVRAGRPWAVIEAGDARMIAFESGLGDGGYFLYRGFGPGGELVAIAVDFRVDRWIYPV